MSTTHPVTLFFLEDTLREGKTKVIRGVSGGEDVRMEISKDEENGIVARVFKGQKKPVTVSGLTLEQADALGWMFRLVC